MNIEKAYNYSHFHMPFMGLCPSSIIHSHSKTVLLGWYVPCFYALWPLNPYILQYFTDNVFILYVSVYIKVNLQRYVELLQQDLHLFQI